ncbi:MAG: SIP domain-containing protein [Microbacterium sp.]|uniref:SIP domain-containing protein n=1 Tax=Microbacterium sp. TaxID=51671 RepID=UPI001AC3F5F5|nr:SIP domain-containing protein [Microbacterium sp.]MBN9178441.1 SIP domain-containing protein [Microbacterium sp.]
MSTLIAHHGTHDAAACKASRHARVQQLITADETSLIELETLVATLPICSTGRVFVEVPDASWIFDLRVPARMIVTWLDRSQRSGAPGTGRACAPGQALARAVVAWSDEMLCDDVAAGDAEERPARTATCAGGTCIHLLGGFLGTADIFDHLTDALGIDAASIATPARFGLAAAH